MSSGSADISMLNNPFFTANAQKELLTENDPSNQPLIVIRAMAGEDRERRGFGWSLFNAVYGTGLGHNPVGVNTAYSIRHYGLFRDTNGM